MGTAHKIVHDKFAVSKVSYPWVPKMLMLTQTVVLLQNSPYLSNDHNIYIYIYIYIQGIKLSLSFN